MRNLEKIPSREIEEALIADADKVDAWDEPIKVAASNSPRSEWFGKEIAIGMGLACRGNQVDAKQVYNFVASRVTDATAYEFKPRGIAAAAIGLYLVLGAVASVTSIANVLWMAYDRFIAPKSPHMRDSACLHIIVERGDAIINLTLGEDVSTKQAFIEQFEAIVAEVRKPDSRLRHKAKIRELEESDSWVRVRATRNDR